MDLLLHGVKDSEFEIVHDDTLSNDWDELRELNPANKPTFSITDPYHTAQGWPH
jgi:type I restriction enzyme M protein